MNSTHRAWLVGLLGLLGAVAAQTSVVPMSLPELAGRCEHAITGTVLAVNSYWNLDGSQILTDIQIRVRTDFRGNVDSPAGVLTLTELGGTVGETTMLVSDAPSFNVGEEVLVFTERVPDGRLIVLGRFQGKLTLLPAPGIALDEYGHRVDDGVGSPEGLIGCFEPGQDLVVEVQQLMLARGCKPICHEAPKAGADAGAVKALARRNTEEHTPAQPLQGDMLVVATELPADVPWGGVRHADGEGRDDRACAGTLVYGNSAGAASYYAPGAGVQLSDDLNLSAGAAAYSLTCYTLEVYSPSGSAYDVTAALYTDCPGSGGREIAGTAGSWPSVAVGSIQTLQNTLGSAVTIPNKVWMVVTFSTAQAGWVIRQPPEVGWSENIFGAGAACGGSFGSYPTSPYSAFGVSLYCSSAVNCEGDAQIGNLYFISNLFPLYSANNYSRSMSLIRRSELSCVPGSITHLAVFVYQAGAHNFTNVEIRMKTTTDTSVTTAWDGTGTLVWSGQKQFNTTGWHVFDITDFNWSSDNLLITWQWGGSSTSNYPTFAAAPLDPNSYCQNYAYNNSNLPTTMTGVANARVLYQLRFGGATAPNISDVNPSSAPAGVGSAGPVGSLVTLTGTNFGTKGVNDHVAFYSYPRGTNPIWYVYNDAYIASWTSGQITCYVPAGASSGDVAVVKGGTWSNKPTFSVTFSNWVRWKDQSVMPIGYYVNTNSIAGVTLASAQASLQTWENVTGDYLDHSYLGTSTRPGSNHADGNNDIAWQSTWTYGTGVIAQTTVVPYSGVIIETDMELNAQNFTWSSSGDPNTMDVQNIVTHEAGHGWVGLNDLYGSADSEKTMYGNSTTGETKKRSLEVADSAGCQWIYAITYCPAWAKFWYEYISRVQVGTIDNLTSYTPGGYSSCTAQSTSMDIGTGYAISVTNGLPYTGDQCGVWVDWNQDGDFSDPDETITISGGPTTFTGTITPPAGATTGNTRLRVRILYTGAFGPCGEALFGEVEDYTICVNTLPPTSASSDRDNFCADDGGNISLTATGGSGTTLRWFNDTCGGTSIGTGSPLVIASPITTTTYSARWENSCGNSTCASATVTVSPLPTSPTGASVDRDWFCPNDAGDIMLAATGGSGGTYEWYADSCGGTHVGTGSPSIASPATTMTYYVRRENTCGNSSCQSVTVHVDTSGPTFTPVTGIPSDVTAYCDAPYSYATGINVGTATATDDHNGVSSIVATLPDGSPLPTQWPPDVYQIKWTATDGCGNTTIDDTTQQVTVLGQNQLVVDVGLAGGVASSFTRCITFTLYDCDGNTKTVASEIAFTSGVATNVNLLVDCGDYSCILAQDVLHTLTRRLDRGTGLIVDDRKYVAAFTGTSHSLIGGDLYDDPFGDYIDIVDFGVFIGEWGTTYDPNTTCTTPWPHADIDGSGFLDTQDFGFITSSFLVEGEVSCCGGLDRRGTPRTSISISELYGLGLGHVAVADLNHDGVVDLTDVELFLSGVRPMKPTPSVGGTGEVNENKNEDRE